MKTIKIEDILKKSRNLNRSDKNLIKKAYDFAKDKHKYQKRKTGEPYITHPLATAYYIADIGLGRDAICAALLHDVIEDCGVTAKEIKENFNQTIANLVEGVTTLRHTGKKKFTKDSVENLRRFFIVVAKDIRAVAIKLADRLHNAKTIHGLSPERQKTYAKEIKYVYSTLANYIGIGYFARQFDDIAFKILNPSEYKKIEDYLKTHHKQRKKYIEKIISKTEQILSKNKLKATVQGREKSIYSFYKKIQRLLREGRIHSKSEYGRVYDNYGFRILVNTVEQCYKALGIIHSTWPPLTGEIEDYIANPKPNGYKSLHTKVFCDQNKIAEFQIRTYEMHDYNEYGPASHIAYKLSEKKYVTSLAFDWLRNISIFRRKDTQKKQSQEFKVELFKNNIFVLTPENEVKQLPKGGTPVDFAYSVHTEVGNKCRGAKVNGKLVPLNHQLSTGDQVEILIDKNAKYPIPKWLEFVVSSSTRSKIKQALREKEKNEAIQKGKEKLDFELKKYNTTFKQIYRTRKNEFDILIYKNNSTDIETFLANIGFGLISIDKLISELFPKEQSQKSFFKKEKNISIEGSTRTEYTKALCCKPKEGDEIVALTTITRGIRIHKKDCKCIRNFDPKMILEAKWV